MKKIPLICLMTTVVGGDLCGAASVCYNPYIGGALGTVTSRHRIDITRDRVGQNPQRDRLNLTDQSFSGGALLGFQGVFHRFYMGGEVDYIASNSTDRGSFNVSPANPAGEKFSVKSGGALGMAVRLGGLVTDSLTVYARFGVEHRRFSISVDRSNTVNDIARSARKTAFTPGVGIMAKINDSWHLGAEGRTAFYKKMTSSAGTTDGSVWPRMDTYLMTLTYHFPSYTF